MIKEVILGLIILAYVVPFVYIFVAVLGDVVKRMTNVFSLKLKPALVLITKSIIE